MNPSSLIIHNSKFAIGATLYAQMAESEKLDTVIRDNLKGLGYGQSS